ncbi:MAG: hypothetical protein AAF363_06330 [Bacteroidota bacterium]
MKVTVKERIKNPTITVRHYKYQTATVLTNLSKVFVTPEDLPLSVDKHNTRLFET